MIEELYCSRGYNKQTLNSHSRRRIMHESVVVCFVCGIMKGFDLAPCVLLAFFSVKLMTTSP